MPAVNDTIPIPADLEGRRAVVTGAANGIGLAIARRLLWAKARVAVVDVDEDGLKTEPAFNEHADCRLIVGDLAGPDVPSIADELLRDGPVDLIVNNVGISTEHSFLSIDEQQFDDVLGTNLKGPWFFTKRLVEALISEREAGRPRRGSVLFISSLHDTYVAERPHYSTSKAGVAMLTLELARELGPYGIRVNAISPGWIRTAADPESPDQLAKYAGMLPLIPLGEPGHPDDVARVALFLLSDAWARYVTGANVRVDGGLSLFSWKARHGD